MKSKKNPNDALTYTKDAFLENPVASATECTGMANTVPENDEEQKTILELHDVFPKGKRKK